MTHPTDTAKSDELKACAHCTAPGYLIGHSRKGTFRVKCTGCELQTKPSLYRNEVVAAWNRRSSPPQNDAGGEGLRALEELVSACEADFTSEGTEAPHGDDAPEDGPWGFPDEESVSSGADGESAVTFGHIRRARKAIAALRTPMSELQAMGQERETTFEVWQGDMMVASSTDEADARHYLAVYSRDGPVRLVRAETVRSPLPSAPSGEGSDHG